MQTAERLDQSTGGKPRLVSTGVSSSRATWTRYENPVAIPQVADILPQEISETLSTLLSDRAQLTAWTEKTPLIIKQVAAQYRTLPPASQELFRQSFNSFLENSHANKYKRAYLLLKVSDELVKRDDPDGTKKLPTTRSLVAILDQKDFDTVGTILQQKKADRATVATSTQEVIPDLNETITNGIVDAYIALGAASETSGKGPDRVIQANARRSPSYTEARNAVAAHQVLQPPIRPNVRPTSLDEIIETHEEAALGMKVDTITVDVDKPSIKVLTIAEPLLGYASADPRTMERIIQTATSKKETKPDVVVVSGIVYGGHEYRQKTLRGLTTQSLDLQFASGNVALREVAKKSGAVVVYSMGDNDHEIARDIALNAMRSLRKTAGKLHKSEAGDDYLSWEQQDQLIRDPEFQHHQQIATHIMFEYCLRAGRALRSKADMEKLSGQSDIPDEYTLVYNAYQQLLSGGKVDSTYRKYIDVDAIPVPGKAHNDFFVEDNFDLVSRVNKTRQLLTKYRHNLKLSGTPVYQNPTDTGIKAIHQLLAQGQELDALVSMHHHMAVGSQTAEGAWFHSTSGLLRRGADVLDYRGEVLGAQGTHSRQVQTRGSQSVPGAEIHEDSADGRHTVWFMNNELLDLAGKSKERVTIAQFIDWQTGSVTMRPDLQLKFLDMVKQKLMNGEKVYIYWGGDIIQGRNYPGMPNENARIGLIRIEDQKAFVQGMVSKMLDEIPADKRKNVVGVSILPGNHEWNSRYADTGDVHIGYLTDYMSNWLGAAYKPEDVKRMIKAHSAMKTGDGGFMDVWAGKVEVAGYQILLQHLILERGAKGQGGEPINQFGTLVEGESDLMKDVNFALFGHWHHPQYKSVNGKVGVISGSMAGPSGYEHMRGYRPGIGGVFLNLGGGLPPAVEYVGHEALERHVIADGYYSDSQLARRGITTDSDYTFGSDGFIPRRRSAQNALQKELWLQIDDRLNDAQSTMGDGNRFHR